MVCFSSLTIMSMNPSLLTSLYIAARTESRVTAPPPETGALEHSDTRIVCLAPSARAGAELTVNLTLSLNNLDFDDTGLTFQYYAPPRVTTMTPSGGHRTGGTVVTILGEGFDVLAGGEYVSCQCAHTRAMEDDGMRPHASC